MERMTLKATVLFPTYNRERLLREAIESLCKQTVDPRLFEVIVIDNCSVDNTELMIAEMQAWVPFRIVYRKMERNGGCFHSLNVAAEMATTEILASLDSDTWADPNWLKRGIEAFESDDNIAFVSGHIADKPTQPVRFFSLRNGAPKGENPFYPSGNCFYRRSVLLKLGGFDENLSFGDVGTSPLGCSDSDLAWRMKEAGYGYVYRDDVLVYHEVSTVSPIAWLKAHWRIMAIPLLVAKHPGLRQRLIWNVFFMPDNPFFYLLMLGLVLAVAGQLWGFLLALPFIARSAVVPNRRFSLLRLPKLAGRVVMLSLRQSVICSSLIYGSVRARTLVL